MAYKRLTGLAAGAVLLAGMATPIAFAHEHGKMDNSAMFDQVDTNHDGMISAAEHAAHAKAMFDKMDANHDGMVSKAEMEAGMKAMHEEHEEHEHMMKGDKMDSDDKMKKDDDKTPPPTK